MGDDPLQSDFQPAWEARDRATWREACRFSVDVAAVVGGELPTDETVVVAVVACHRVKTVSSGCSANTETAPEHHPARKSIHASDTAVMAGVDARGLV